MPGINDILKDVLGDSPGAAFFSALDGRNGSPNQRRFNQNQGLGVATNAFEGALGQEARGGQIPTLNFVDFLDDFLSRQGLESKFNQQSRFQTGKAENFFNPRTRFQFGF